MALGGGGGSYERGTPAEQSVERAESQRGIDHCLLIFRYMS